MPPHTSVTVRVFTQRFSSTPKGARLARLLAVQQLDAWGVPYSSEVSGNAAVIVAELASNAVAHGRVRGRDFELTLILAGPTLRIAVSDARGERLPRVTGAPQLPETEAGRGLLLVAALADRWGVEPRQHIGKTVWAEYTLNETS
ncbi:MULTISPECIES: ATP-binding protein [Streptomyces]|uniref:ATP-binding protein n=1 Tax=Streptomyces TaxID=1883 RepID=UPI0015FF3F7D|nr:ATP-binding protein [Streptomyces murinus]